MRLVAQLYYVLAKRNDCLRFGDSRRFDQLYWLDQDPFHTESYQDRYFEVLCKLAGSGPFQNAVDFGCGPGFLTRLFAPRCHRIVGVDFSRLAVDLAKARCQHCSNARFVQGDICDFLSPDPVDLFICSEVLYYLNDAQFDKLLQNVRRMAALGAQLIATCRLDDMRVKAKLEDQFSLAGTHIGSEYARRPYVVRLYEVRP